MTKPFSIYPPWKRRRFSLRTLLIWAFAIAGIAVFAAKIFHLTE